MSIHVLSVKHPVQRFLVRRRTVFTWIIPLLLIVASYLHGRRSPAEYGVGVVFVLCGEAIRFWAAGYIQKDDEVTTAGPYAFVRNPLYFGSLLIAFGFAMMSGLGWAVWLLVLVLFSAFHLAAIHSEEEFLRSKFGAEYEEYLSNVPRLVPLPQKTRLGSTVGRFEWHQALENKEQRSALVTLFVACVFAARFLVH